LHQLVTISSADQLQMTTEHLALVPDHRLILLLPLPGSSAGSFLDRWAERATRFSLFCYLEVKLQPFLFEAGSAATIIPVAEYIRQSVCQQTLEVESFVSLGASDLILYLFGNDLDEFSATIERLRDLRLHQFARWCDDNALGNENLANELRKRTSPGHHLCQNTYTLYGVLPRPGSGTFDPEEISRRVVATPTTLRPLVFISVFPGHDREPKLRELLSRHSYGGTTLVTNGLFDLVHCALPDPNTRLTQREVLRDTVSFLSELWDTLGPNGNSPTIMRTNTVWTRQDEPNGEPVIQAHARLVSPPRFGNDDALPNSAGPAGRVLQGLMNAYNAAASNDVSSSYVTDMYPFLRELRDVVVEQSGQQGEESEPYSRSRYFYEGYNDIFVRLEAALGGRTNGVIHTLREEPVARPGASLQKLLAIYASLSRAILRAVLPTAAGPLPRLLFTVGGIDTACSRWYFGAELPRLVIFEIAGRHLLEPASAVLFLAHELMHVVPPSVDQGVLAVPLLREGAKRMARIVLKTGHASASLEREILTALETDLRDAIERRSRAPYLAAEELLRWCGERASYLARLLLAPATEEGDAVNPASMSLDELLNLDDARRLIDRDIVALLELVKESTADVMAAYITSPNCYAQALRRASGTTHERVSILEAVGARRAGHTPIDIEVDISLIDALVVIADSVDQLRANLVLKPEYYDALPVSLAAIEGTGLETLLSAFKGMSV
jgi:hypothetical protein